LKEAEETGYWLELLQESGILMDEEIDGVLDECRQLIAISSPSRSAHGKTHEPFCIYPFALPVLGPIYRAFGERLWPLVEELNVALAA
jgi:hypothetical protein